MNDDWSPINQVMRKVGDLPFPANYWKAEHNGGIDNDAQYLLDQLSRLNITQRYKAVEHYDNLYQGLDNRAECNNRLREFCDRCAAINRGEVQSHKRVL